MSEQVFSQRCWVANEVTMLAVLWGKALWLVESSWGSLLNSHCCTFSEFGCQEISLGSEAQVRTCLHAIFCNARVSLLQVYQAGLAGLKSHIWQDKQGPIRQSVLHHPLSHNPTRYSLHYPTNPNSAVTLETSVEQEVKILLPVPALCYKWHKVPGSDTCRLWLELWVYRSQSLVSLISLTQSTQIPVCFISARCTF